MGQGANGLQSKRPYAEVRRVLSSPRDGFIVENLPVKRSVVACGRQPLKLASHRNARMSKLVVFFCCGLNQKLCEMSFVDVFAIKA
jgi:hypothetical protein